MSSKWQRVANLEEVAWPDSAVLICDEAVVSSAPQSLRSQCIVVSAGEALKTLGAIERLAGEVLQIRASRPLTIVAMGGGSVGDAVGFLASILWRGVDLWHVPTTLLAAVDSAHGGKTAVNLGTAKNQLGTFWEASRTIFADTFLESMPLELRLEGFVELLKALWLGDPAQLDVLDSVGIGDIVFGPPGKDLGSMLDAAVRVKERIVAEDPRETRGVRTWLNLGHTAAHGLELCCGAPHGVAVAWGMACAGMISHERSLLSDDELSRLLRHVAPLMGGVALAPPATAFLAAVGRDKKTVDGRLRSVLLRGPGDPVVVDDVSAAAWLSALERVRAEVFERPLSIGLEAHRAAELTLSASKSELNRALVIAALRDEPAEFSYDSDADDVRAMKAGIAALRRGEVADAKNGGTTFRFLTAVAVCEPNGGRIRVGSQLADRPHEPLLDALRGAGVNVVRTGQEFTFGALPPGPLVFEVDASQSSQFASALLLLRAARPDVEVRVTGSLASEGYFSMTQAMLQASPLDVTPDASSAAMWVVLNALGAHVTFAAQPGPLQPDAALSSWLPLQSAQLDVSGAPDLVPVLAAYAVLTEPALTLTGAPHLRHKESNRIDDLVASFAEVGVSIEARADGVHVRAGRQIPRAGSSFDPRGDHRLAFAALVLSSAAPLRLLEPRCVAKSYPNVFAHARAAGFEIELSWM